MTSLDLLPQGPSGANCSCSYYCSYMSTWWWSSTRACEAAPAMGHMLCSGRSPPCCSQGDSPPAALPMPLVSLCPGHPGEGTVGDWEGS